MRKKIIGHIIYCLAAIFIFNSTYVFADDKDSLEQEINQNNNAINELENKKDSIGEEINKQEEELINIDEKIKKKTEDLNQVQQKVAEYQGDIDVLQYKINIIEEEIIQSENQVKLKKKNLSKLEKERDSKQNLLNTRVRNSYKISTSNQYVYLILKSESLWKAYENINQIWKIVALDKKLINEVKEKEKTIASEIKEIDNELKKQKENKESIVNKQSELVQAQSEFIALKESEENKMYELQVLQSDKEGLIAKLESDQSEIDEDIHSLLAYNEDLQRQLDSIFESIKNEGNASNGENNNNGGSEQPQSGDGSAGSGSSNGEQSDSGFIVPVNGTYTDTFGGRINPVTGVPGNHNGVDIASPTGTPILATKGGVVSYSNWIEGYGNTIILSHGDGVQSLYAHASSLAVSEGQAVSQGDVVAYVGSTGLSTGPHLHFEIRINGTPVDPFNYIPY